MLPAARRVSKSDGQPVRRELVGGRVVLVVERKPPIPPSLELLLSGGRDDSGRRWLPLRVAVRRPLRLGGAAASCLASSSGDPARDHRLGLWLEGPYVCADGIVRVLSLHACTDCGAVCVRDRSFDELPGLSAGRRPPRRRDEVIGWYSGARPRDRVYTL